MHIGPYQLANPLILAPMAGVTDRPFRKLCLRFGAAMAVSEMISCDQKLWHTPKSRLRMQHSMEEEPRSIQIAGADPEMMALAALKNVEQGAQIIDINMGCPAKKVCNTYAGSALLQNEPLVAQIIKAVVNAVDVPVTLKIRTGWDSEHKNGVRIAQIAEQNGIQALAVHGRTRADGYKGNTEYGTIRKIKHSVSIPVIANGDIDTPLKAKLILQYTMADGLMIGRAAHGRPWIFREINHYLNTGQYYPKPGHAEIRQTVLGHLQNIYRFYGDKAGVRIARKHIAWYLKKDHPLFWNSINRIENSQQQYGLVEQFFDKQYTETQGRKLVA